MPFFGKSGGFLGGVRRLFGGKKIVRHEDFVNEEFLEVSRSIAGRAREIEAGWERSRAEREELYGDADADFGLKDFLDGKVAVLTLDSSNVHSFQWFRESGDMEVVFGNDGKYGGNAKWGLRPYVYHDVTLEEARMCYECQTGAKPPPYGTPNPYPPQSPGVAVHEILKSHDNERGMAKRPPGAPYAGGPSWYS